MISARFSFFKKKVTEIALAIRTVTVSKCVDQREDKGKISMNKSQWCSYTITDT